MLKIHKISDIRSVEAYLLDNVKPYDIIIADDYNPYEIKRSLLNKREVGVVFDVQFTSILRLAKKYMEINLAFLDMISSTRISLI